MCGLFFSSSVKQCTIHLREELLNVCRSRYKLLQEGHSEVEFHEVIGEETRSPETHALSWNALWSSVFSFTSLYAQHLVLRTEGKLYAKANIAKDTL